MPRAVFALLLVLLLAPCARSDDLPDADRERFAKVARSIQHLGLGAPGAMRMLEELCRTAPRRLSGSQGILAAEAWAQQAMKEVGLTKIRLDPVTVPHWKRGTVEELRMVTKGTLLPESLPILALGGSVATPEGGVQAEVLEVTGFEDLAELASEAEGKIVFFNGPMDPTLASTGTAYGRAVPQRTRGAIEAAKVGAVAVVVRSMTTRLDDVPHTGVMRYEKGVPKIPAVAVSTRGAERLSTLLEEGRIDHMSLRLDCRTLPDTTAHTVIGELEGSTKKDEIVLLGAHLDSWDVGPGAHDDGAGCVHVLEAVRLLTTLRLRPRRTIRVVLYACEEQGIFGGRAYAEAHADELDKHVVAIESDSGGFTPRGFSTNGGERARAILAAAAAPLEPIGANSVRKGGGGPDIGPLAASGVVLVGFRADTQRYFDVHHAATDTLDTVNERELELGAVAIATLAYAIADLEETLPRGPPKEEK